MACSRCNQLNCMGGCIKSPCDSNSNSGMITRNNSFENKSEGRDGESAYDAYVRNGGTLTFEQWSLAVNSNIYSQYNW